MRLWCTHPSAAWGLGRGAGEGPLFVGSVSVLGEVATGIKRGRGPHL